MSDAIKVWGAPEGWDAFLLAQRRREFAGSVLHVTRVDVRQGLAHFAAFGLAANLPGNLVFRELGAKPLEDFVGGVRRHW